MTTIVDRRLRAIPFFLRLPREPIGDVQPSAILFNHLVDAGEDRWRDRQSQRVSGFAIDDQLEFGRLLNRQIPRLRALRMRPTK